MTRCWKMRVKEETRLRRTLKPIQQRDSREQEPTTFRGRRHRRRGGPQIHTRRRRHAAARARGEQPDGSVTQGDYTLWCKVLGRGVEGRTWHASTRYLACSRIGGERGGAEV